MLHTEVWKRIQASLKKSLPGHAYNTWFDPITSIGLNANELILEVPNQFSFEWIESHYKRVIENAARQEIDPQVSLKYTVAPVKTPPPPAPEETLPPAPRPDQPRLNHNYTFTNFIEGAQNQFAKAACRSVAESPGQQAFNPLVIYGGVGMGKTHLLHAIGNWIISQRPELRVVCASSEKFTQDFITAIQKSRTIEFTRSYRQAHVLLIDDIQFFRGKEQTQEQFFHTFNELHQAGRQIVLTADRIPGEMVGLQDRLLSRFQSGLTTDIQPPDFETRVAILMEKAEQNGVQLPYDMIEFIATHVVTNVRELESTIIHLLAYSSLSNREIDLPLLKKVIRERMGKRGLRAVTVEDIIRRVADTTRITELEIVGGSRKMPIAEARQVSIFLCREILGTSLVNLGTHFGGRDHTTILHACRNIESKVQSDPRIQGLVEGLRQEFAYTGL